MNKLFFLISFQYFMILQSQAQTWNWVQSIGNNNAETTTYKIFPISSGETFTLSNYSDVTTKLIMTIIDSSGKYSWIKLLDGKVNFSGADVDSKGNVYISANSTYNVNYDSTTIVLDGEFPMFVMKYNKMKELVWIKNLNHERQLIYKDLYIENDNRLIFSGQYFKNGERYLGIDILDSNLQVVSQKAFKMNINDYSTFEQLELDAENNILSAGYFRNAITISDSIVLYGDSLNYTPIVVKLNSNLDVLNAVAVPQLMSISGISSYNNKVTITGQSISSYNGAKIFRYDESLSNITDSILIINKEAQAKGISHDENGNIYVGITCSCDSLKFGETEYQAYSPPSFVQNVDAALLKYDNSFNEMKMWVLGKDYAEDMNYFYVINEDHFLVSGSYASAEVKFGDLKVVNNSPIINVGFHWLPIYTRKMFTFFASYGQSNPSTSLNIRHSLPITIFPNPASSFINIRWAEAAKEIGRLDIYAVDGRWLSAEYIFPGQQQHQVNIEQLVPGTYFITLNINGNVSTAQWIKH